MLVIKFSLLLRWIILIDQLRLCSNWINPSGEVDWKYASSVLHLLYNEFLLALVEHMRSKMNTRMHMNRCFVASCESDLLVHSH